MLAPTAGQPLHRGGPCTWWVYVGGTVLLGAMIAVDVATILRGHATAQERQAAMGTPLQGG